MVWVKIKLQGRRHLLAAAYYNPDTSDEESKKTPLATQVQRKRSGPIPRPRRQRQPAFLPSKWTANWSPMQRVQQKHPTTSFSQTICSTVQNSKPAQNLLPKRIAPSAADPERDNSRDHSSSDLALPVIHQHRSSSTGLANSKYYSCSQERRALQARKLPSLQAHEHIISAVMGHAESSKYHLQRATLPPERPSLRESADSEQEKGKQTDALYMAFSKAFGMLHHYAIIGQVNTWIQSFLDNRRQTVAAETASSGFVCVEPGVPQGSVLSPFLFLIYINDFQEDLSLPTIHSVTRTPLVHINKQLCNKTWTALLTGKEMAHVVPSFPHQQEEEPVLPPVPPSWPPSKIYQRDQIPAGQWIAVVPVDNCVRFVSTWRWGQYWWPSLWLTLWLSRLLGVLRSSWGRLQFSGSNITNTFQIISIKSLLACLWQLPLATRKKGNYFL